MNRDGNGLERLLGLARRAGSLAPVPVPDGDPGADVPPGFAARVASRWAAERPASAWDLWDRATRWGLAVAVVVGVFAFLFHRSAPAPEATPFDSLVCVSRAEVGS